MKHLAGSIGAFVQNFVEEKKTFHITSNDMKTITHKIYGKEIKIEEGINETTYEYYVEKDDSQELQESVEEAIERGYLGHWSYGDILKDLCNRGLLEKGDYFIYYTW